MEIISDEKIRDGCAGYYDRYGWIAEGAAQTQLEADIKDYRKLKGDLGYCNATVESLLDDCNELKKDKLTPGEARHILETQERFCAFLEEALGQDDRCGHCKSIEAKLKKIAGKKDAG